jgi:hypothetical protein
VAHQVGRFLRVSGIGVHLTTTSLGFAKLDCVAEPLQNTHNCFTGFGEESVVVAGDEKRNDHEVGGVFK